MNHEKAQKLVDVCLECPLSLCEMEGEKYKVACMIMARKPDVKQRAYEEENIARRKARRRERMLR